MIYYIMLEIIYLNYIQYDILYYIRDNLSKLYSIWYIILEIIYLNYFKHDILYYIRDNLSKLFKYDILY